MRSFITVIGRDSIGIIASLSIILSEKRVNILDINQTVMHGMFTMIMLVDNSEMTGTYMELSEALEHYGNDRGLSVRIQREEVFNSMHRI